MFQADLALFYRINNLAGSSLSLDAVMLCIAKYGPLVFGLILLWSWFGRGTKEDLIRNRKTVIYAVCSALIGLGINQIIGHFYFRPRPYAEHTVRLLLDRSPDPSFPSDHSTGGFSLASMFFLSDRKTGAMSLGLAAVLAFSRVYTGVHYPFDVFGGAATGLISTAIVYLLRYKLEPLTHLVLCTWDKILHLLIRKGEWK